MTKIYTNFDCKYSDRPELIIDGAKATLFIDENKVFDIDCSSVKALKEMIQIYIDIFKLAKRELQHKAVNNATRIIMTNDRMQKWHVCWIAKIPGRQITYGDGVYSLKQSITKETIDLDGLRAKLAIDTGNSAKTDVTPSQINITCLTRLY